MAGPRRGEVHLSSSSLGAAFIGMSFCKDEFPLRSFGLLQIFLQFKTPFCMVCRLARVLNLFALLTFVDGPSLVGSRT